MSAANRGKWAEGVFRDFCTTWSENDAGFTFMRLPDAHAGSFTPTTADFLLAFRGTGAMVEIKEVGHDFRLPAKNLKTDQLGRLRMWALAGFRTRVLVAHTTLKESCGPYRAATAKLWRSVPVTWLLENPGPSWDLRQFTLYTASEVTNPARITE